MSIYVNNDWVQSIMNNLIKENDITFTTGNIGTNSFYNNTYTWKKESEMESFNFAKIFRPKHVYANFKKHTVTVWWAYDDSRTTVTCSEMDEFNVEDGFRAALAKKIFGSYEKYSKYINKAIING
jgi:hypothetical protein